MPDVIVEIDSRPVEIEVGVGPEALADILTGIASIRGRAADWGVVNDVTQAEELAGQSVEADFTQDYYRSGFAEGSAPAIMPGWSFSRAGVGTMFNAAGVIESFASGVPRITDRGLLVERAATNLLLRSQEFDNAAWTKVSGGNGADPTVTANAAVAPDGTTTADEIVFNRGASNVGGDISFLSQVSISTVSAAVYSGSIWLRSNTPCSVLLRHVGSASYTLLNVTNAWTRFALSETASGTSSAFELGLRGGFGVSQTAMVETWGGQLEATETTSYIATAGSAATRAADIATGPSIASSGTILMEFEVPPHDGVLRRLVTFPDHIPLYVQDGLVGSSEPASQLFASGAPLAAGSMATAAVTWTAGRRAIVRNGGTVVSDANPLPSNPLVYIGGDGGQFSRPIRRFVRFNVAVSDAQLQAMTA